MELVKGLGYVALTVPEIDQSLDFYRRIAHLKVSERGGRLVADSGPPWLAGLLDVPGPWDGISVHADGAAVRVSRRPSADTPAAAFLYDLALAERIAAAAGAYRTG